MKRAGQWETYGTRGSKKQVIEKTKEYVDTSLRASLRIQNVKTKQFVQLKPTKRYRHPKGKLKTPTILIEKKHLRLSSRSEVAKIHAIKKTTPKKRRKK